MSMQMNEETSIWITDLSQIPTANIASLRRSLITLDGRGQTIKEAALNELLDRTAKTAIQSLTKGESR